MDIKEFAFKAKPGVDPKDSHVQLTCQDCGLTEMRPRVDPYSGHMYEQIVSYTCSICRGNMNLLTNEQEIESNE